MSALKNEHSPVLATAAELKIITPYRIICVGPSGCGKSHFSSQFIRYHSALTDSKVQNPLIIYAYHTREPEITDPDSGRYRFHKGLPSIDAILQYKTKEHEHEVILVLDDLQSQLASLKGPDYQAYESLFIEISRKERINCLVLCQDYFCNSPLFRCMRRNTSAFVTYPTLSDVTSQGRFLATIYGRGEPAQRAKEALEHAHDIKKEFSAYLFTSTHPFERSAKAVRSRNFVGFLPPGTPKEAVKVLCPEENIFVYNIKG